MPALIAVSLAAVWLLAVGIYRLWTREWPLRSAAGWTPLRWRALAGSVAASAVLLGVAIQLVPYGRDHSNPPVLAEPAWDSPRTRELARRACFDCHSNEVEWPWYSNVAPMSWLVLGHVEEGRDELNFSEWGRRHEIDEIVESVVEDEMPPGYYTFINSKGRLSDAERAELLRGLRATFGDGERDDD